MTSQEMENIALDAMCNCFLDGTESEDNIYDEAFTLALDALTDVGILAEIAGPIAQKIAQRISQP